ncbi:metallophosphoesterase family protein [bacterium]|nr:metallophosphoesterase family protein [bacterium]
MDEQEIKTQTAVLPESLKELRTALNILAGSDLHESQGGLDWFCAQATALQPDLVIFLGDFVTFGPLAFLREALRELRDLAPHCYVIPGNCDPRDALPIIDREAYDGLRHLHKTSAALNGYSFAGLGGSCRTPDKITPLEMEDEMLAAPFPVLLPADVWLLHQPLFGYCDQLASGLHVGSQELRQIYGNEAEPPLLVLSGHIHEAVGIERENSTVFVNPGSLKERSAAWIRLSGHNIDVEVLTG